MKKIMNSPEHYVQDMLSGIYRAHPAELTFAAGDPHCLVTAQPRPGKVAIVTGGGSGHLPLFLGYVGKGLLDGCAVGEVFQSPSADQILSVTKAVHQGAGVLFLYGNYNGDIFNFNMAAEMAGFEEGISVETVVANDDIAAAVADPQGVPAEKRRGVAGIFFAYKCAGAAAELGGDLQEVKRIAEKACKATRTIGFALSPCTVPEAGAPGFLVQEGQVEIGMGIHGEKGLRTEALMPADSLVDELLSLLFRERDWEGTGKLAVLVNGLGGTPLDELYIMVNRISQTMEHKKIAVSRYYVGEFVTAMEMAGASISLCWLDDELEQLLDHPAATPFFKQL